MNLWDKIVERLARAKLSKLRDQVETLDFTIQDLHKQSAQKDQAHGVELAMQKARGFRDFQKWELERKGHIANEEELRQRVTDTLDRLATVTAHRDAIALKHNETLALVDKHRDQVAQLQRWIIITHGLTGVAPINGGVVDVLKSRVKENTK